MAAEHDAEQPPSRPAEAGGHLGMTAEGVETEYVEE
jgi:hypothetical protein